jgi:hypothetical protein
MERVSPGLRSGFEEHGPGWTSRWRSDGDSPRDRATTAAHEAVTARGAVRRLVTELHPAGTVPGRSATGLLRFGAFRIEERLHAARTFSTGHTDGWHRLLIASGRHIAPRATLTGSSSAAAVTAGARAVSSLTTGGAFGILPSRARRRRRRTAGIGGDLCLTVAARCGRRSSQHEEDTWHRSDEHLTHRTTRRSTNPHPGVRQAKPGGGEDE